MLYPRGMKWKLCSALLVLALWGWSFPSPAAAIIFRNAASGLAASGAIPLTISVPAGTLQNDVMVAAIAARPNTVTVTPPAGWTALPRIDQATATASSLLIYYRVATASDVVGGVTYTWCLNSAAPPACTGGAGTAPTGGAGGITSFGGVDTTTPIGTVYNGQTVVAGTSFPAPALTTTVANTMVMTHHEFASSMTWANPTNMAQAFQQANLTPPNSGGISLQGNYVLQAAIATIGPGSCATATTPGPWCAAVTANADPGVTHILALSPCAKPSDSSYVAATAQTGQGTVYWSSSNPVIVLQKATTAFSTEAPADGTIYTAGQTGGALGTATVAYDGATGDTNVTCTATSCTRTSLTNGTTYYYKVFAKTGSGGASCYAPGTVNTAAGVSATPNTGATKPDWTYIMAGGSILKAGIASWNGTIYTSSNANRLISLSTTSPKGTQSWAPQATTAAIQGWLTWLPVGSGGIKSVQTGSVTIATNPQSVGVTTVDPSRAFVVCAQRDGSSNASRRTTCELSASSVTFNAGEIGTVVQWYVAEFKGGVSVQRSTTTFATTDTIWNVPISQVDLTKSFVLTSEWTLDTLQNNDEEWTMRAQLTSSSNLELSRNTGAANQPVTVAWQVVSMAAASVRRGTTSINSGTQNFVTVPLAPAVDPNQSFLVFSRRAPTTGGIEGDYQVTGEITGGGLTLTFTRADTKTNAVDIAWEVVSLNDGTTVQRGKITSDLTDNPLNATLSPAIVTAQSIPLISVSGAFSPTDTADIDSTTYTAIFTSTTNLQMQRASNPNMSATVAWQVVQFATNGGGAVVIGGEQGSGSPLSGRVISVDPTFGFTNWETNLRAVTGVDADSFQAPAASQMRAYSNATFQSTFTDDVIFVVTRNSSGTPVCGSMSTNNKIFALKASDGSVLWTFNGTCTSTVDYIVGMPAVDYARNRLYVTSHAGGGAQPSLWVINTLNGSLVQSFALGHLDMSATPSYDGSTLYVADTTGKLYAVNLNTLTLKWAAPNYMNLGSAINGFVWEDGALAGYLYFSTADGNVWCIRDPGVGAAPPSTPPASPQAACPWKTLVNATGVSNLLPLDGAYVGIYVGGADGTLRKLNPTSGAVDKTFTVDATPRTVGDPSTETGNEVFVSTTEGRIYKILLPLP